MLFNLKKIKKINISILILSFLISTATWYNISVRDRMSVQLKVHLDYKNVPNNLIVTSGLVDAIEVHLRGPKALLQGVHTDKRPTHTVDLKTLRRGKNTLPFTPTQWKENYRAFELVDVKPSHLVVYTEIILEKVVPIVPNIDVNLDDSVFIVENVKLNPSSALIRGPESLVQEVNELPLFLQIDSRQQPGTYTKTFPLLIETAQTTVTPSQVQASYTVVSKRTQHNIPKKISINGPHDSYEIKPVNVILSVEFPENLKNDKEYLEKATVRVAPPILDVGQTESVKLQFILPEGMTLSNKQKVKRVQITRIR